MKKYLKISSKNIKNNSSKKVNAESYLKSNFVCNAKRNTKIRNYCRGKESNPLWWDLPNSLVLQKIEIEVAYTESNSHFSNRQTISSGRVNTRNNICDNLRNPPAEQNKNGSFVNIVQLSSESYLKKLNSNNMVIASVSEAISNPYESRDCVACSEKRRNLTPRNDIIKTNAIPK